MEISWCTSGLRGKYSLCFDYAIQPLKNDDIFWTTMSTISRLWPELSNLAWRVTVALERINRTNIGMGITVQIQEKLRKKWLEFVFS
jgi:hypothetical protein